MFNLLNIKTIALSKGVTIKSILKQINKTEAGFYKSLENNSMNIKTVAEVAEVLGVTISELIGEMPDKKRLKKSKDEFCDQSSELSRCYKIMYEQQVEITRLTQEVECLKNGFAPGNGANVG